MTRRDGGRGRSRPGSAGIALAALALLAGPGPLAAQAPTLEAVDSLVRAGMAEEARAALTRWMETSAAGASRPDVQRSIWLRGVLTVDPAQAALDFQRLVVEFPSGPWTDDALLRLARYAEARDDLADAAHHYRALARDHPGSPAGIEARGWLERHPAAATASAPAPAADEDAPPDTLGRERVARPAPAAGDTASPSPSSRGAFTVQLGAFSTDSRARALVERVRRAGFEPRLVRVPGSDLLRVRVGRVADETAAHALRDRVVAGGFDAIVAADAGRETLVGGGGPPV